MVYVRILTFLLIPLAIVLSTYFSFNFGLEGVESRVRYYSNGEVTEVIDEFGTLGDKICLSILISILSVIPIGIFKCWLDDKIEEAFFQPGERADYP